MGNNTARSLTEISKTKGWDPTELMNGFDADPGAYRDSGNGLGKLDNAPAVNTGSKPIAARNPAIPGGTGDPSEPTIFDSVRAITWNTPGKSDQRAALKADRGIEQGVSLAAQVPWSSPEPSYVPPPIGSIRKSSGLGTFPTGGAR